MEESSNKLEEGLKRLETLTFVKKIESVTGQGLELYKNQEGNFVYVWKTVKLVKEKGKRIWQKKKLTEKITEIAFSTEFCHEIIFPEIPEPLFLNDKVVKTAPANYSELKPGDLYIIPICYEIVEDKIDFIDFSEWLSIFVKNKSNKDYMDEDDVVVGFMDWVGHTREFIGENNGQFRESDVNWAKASYGYYAYLYLYFLEEINRLDYLDNFEMLVFKYDYLYEAIKKEERRRWAEAVNKIRAEHKELTKDEVLQLPEVVELTKEYKKRKAIIEEERTKALSTPDSVDPN